MPGGSSGIVYRPDPVVLTVWLTPVASLVAVTLALGITAPWGSSTRPVIVATLLCAVARTDRKQSRTSENSNKCLIQFSLFLFTPAKLFKCDTPKFLGWSLLRELSGASPK